MQISITGYFGWIFGGGRLTATLRCQQVSLRAQAIAPITSLQPRYSLVHREVEETTMPYCARENIGVIAYSPMASGLLTGSMSRERIAGLPADDWRKRHPDFQEPLLSRNLRLVSLLRTIGKRQGRTPAEVAVAWVLRNSAVTGAIVGARRPQQVEGWLPAAVLELKEDDLADIAAAVHATGAGTGPASPPLDAPRQERRPGAG